MRARSLAALVAGAAYLAFWVWYGGSTTPLAQSEVDALIASIETRAREAGSANPAILAALRQLGEADDGREFMMLNLIRHRQRAVYPPGSGYGEDVEAAERRYAEGIIPRLLKRAAFPVFVGEPTGRFLHPDHARDWDQVALVRYRSRRDFLEMVAEPGMRELGEHKWASVEETQVFPVRPGISFIWVRSAVAVLFAFLGGALPLALSRIRGSRQNRA